MLLDMKHHNFWMHQICKDYLQDWIYKVIDKSEPAVLIRKYLIYYKQLKENSFELFMFFYLGFYKLWYLQSFFKYNGLL